MKKALIFAATVCGLSWTAALIFHLTTGYTGPESGPEAALKYQTFASLYMFLPLIVVLLLQLIGGKMRITRPHATRIKVAPEKSALTRFKLHWGWLAASLLAIVVVGLSILISGLFANVVGPKEGTLMMLSASFGGEIPEAQLAQLEGLTNASLLGVTLLSGIFAGCTINALFAFGEEYGWRCYMVDALRERSFLSAALVIGLVWGIWHAPLILMGHNYPAPDGRVAGVLMMTLFCLLAGVVELYLVCKCGTVWPAVIFHGTINAVAGLGVLMIPEGNPLITGATGVAGMIALLVVIGGLFLYDRYISRNNIFSRTLGASLTKGDATSEA